MKLDKSERVFYLIIGICEMILALFLIIHRHYYTLGIILFLLGVLVILKDCLGWIKFSLIDYLKKKAGATKKRALKDLPLMRKNIC